MFIDPFVLRSLNRSELRKKILMYLNEIYPPPHTSRNSHAP